MILILLGLVSFAAWFISMLAGGGSPFVLIPLVNGLFGSQAVAPVITTGMLVGNAQRTLFFWRDVNWPVTWWYTPGAIAGAGLGAYTLTRIHLEYLQLLIALVLLLMVANYCFDRWAGQQQRSFVVKTWQFLPLGFLYAFLSGLVGSTGPIMNPIYLNYGLVKEQMIATKSLNVVVVHVAKIIAYGALGMLSLPYLAYGLVIGLAGLPANWLGKMVLDKMSNEQFQHAVLGFVAVSGVVMLWQQRQFLFLL
jgi:uncharacterized protein